MSNRSIPKRRDSRVPVRVPVRISTLDAETDPGSGRRYFRASQEICTNLSRGGVFIRTADPLEPGRRLLVELELPDGRPFEAIGRVAWAKQPLGSEDAEPRGVGVQFLGSAPGQFTTLEAYLKSKRGRGTQRGASKTRRNAPGPAAPSE